MLIIRIFMFSTTTWTYLSWRYLSRSPLSCGFWWYFRIKIRIFVCIFVNDRCVIYRILRWVPCAEFRCCWIQKWVLFLLFETHFTTFVVRIRLSLIVTLWFSTWFDELHFGVNHLVFSSTFTFTLIITKII